MIEQETMTVISRTLQVIAPIPADKQMRVRSQDDRYFTATHILAEVVLDIPGGVHVRTVYAFTRKDGYVMRTEDVRLYARDRDMLGYADDGLVEYLVEYTKELRARDWSSV